MHRSNTKHNNDRRRSEASSAFFPSGFDRHHTTHMTDPSPAPSLRFLHLVWCTLAGLRCTRVVVLQSEEDSEEDGGEGASSIERPGPSLCRACITLPAYADVPSPGSGVDGTGSVRLQPDPSTKRPIPWAPSGGRAPSSIALVNMLDDFNQGRPWSLCPRGLLQRVLSRAEADHGLSFRAGFEIEFSLVQAGGGEPIFGQTYCSSRCGGGLVCWWGSVGVAHGVWFPRNLSLSV